MTKYDAAVLIVLIDKRIHGYPSDHDQIPKMIEQRETLKKKYHIEDQNVASN